MATDTQVEEGQLVSRQEAARLADVHVNTIRLWEEHGRLNPVKQENGRVMIRLSELEPIVKERNPVSNAEQRVIELEAENGILRAENGILRAENVMLRDTLSQLRAEHGELLTVIKSLAQGKE